MKELDELIDHAVHVARYQECPGRHGFLFDADDHGGAVHRCLHGIMHLIEDHAKTAGIPRAICSQQAGGGGQADPGTAASGCRMRRKRWSTLYVRWRRSGVLTGRRRLRICDLHFIEKICDQYRL